MVSDPDYINSFPAVLIQDDVITFQSILELIEYETNNRACLHEALQ
jgi:hypothetical protein